VPGGLYRSSDKAETWRLVNETRTLHWPIDFALHPTDPETIYIAARNGPGFGTEGGIHKTTDGGKTWKQLTFDRAIDGSFSVAVHPDRPDIIYACTWGRGLWRSRDAGKTWEDVEGVPFMTILRVFFDPKDSSTMYVGTTGSSIWKGPAF
jgi:photosystem II stability/assembly factor-like uncharacterized protein